MDQLKGWRRGIAAGCIGLLLPIVQAGAETDSPSRLPARQAEFLDRGLVAVQTDGGVFLSWRLLGSESYDAGFNLYRNGRKLNRKPLTSTTNYLDPAGTAGSTYTVRRVFDGREQPLAAFFEAVTQGRRGRADSAEVWEGSYLPIPLQRPADGVTPVGEAYTYRANDASVGDLDGDGEYEIVLKWDPSNQKDNSQSGYTGEVFVDAYKLDGTLLWRISLGRNIRAGAHYTQFMVYDFDGDGKAEVAMKTADGSTDARGTVIGDPAADYRNTAGYVLSGPEYLTMFDGATGKALATIDYVPARGTVESWGDNYGNRVDRFLGGVAYLDGRHPSLIMSRGYYTRTVIVAWDWKHGQLTQRWVFDSDVSGAEYRGQGNHQLAVADVDSDGKDEIVFGAMTIDDNGTVLYNTALGHGDALHVGDLDPNRPGLEVFKVMESRTSPYGLASWDAATGAILWGKLTAADTGRGMSADIDPTHPGEEMWSSAGGGLHTATGDPLTGVPSTINFGIWWDGDLSRELLDHTYDSVAGAGVGRIDKWDYLNSVSAPILVAAGTYSNNGTKGTPALQADILGDWREEAIWRSQDSSELRIYTTTAPTEYKLRTLMHDPTYRLAVAWQNVAYNQPPHPGFFLGTDMKLPPAARLYFPRPRR
ncbi:rhamnogalacturonan lyase [Peristeroidobacter agariperforans]|uniref:rhamnogalacturonan lyase n=1 Tax=Peristeroidobacter agariperforans TaxID=268404 RepID=UPI00101C69B7|nr:rhamnogalacturonan lyase [Peristeroidobacter agariperforans]